MIEQGLVGRILVVEDDESHRLTLTNYLTKAGHVARAVGDAEAALAEISAFQPELVISDVRMPGLSGFDLLDRLGEHTDVSVILITAYEGVTGAINAMRNGAYDYLIKPLDLDRLDEVVGACLRDRRSDRGEPTAASEPIEDFVHRRIVGEDPAMLRICKTIGTVARTRASVLVRGETGTGKELIARAIHDASATATEPFVAVDCTAIPETLLESALFGHVAGAFTGAKESRRGRFELAGRGTVFLDEIGDTTLAFQAKLLRVLQEREFYPVGSETPRRTEARVLAATHQPLAQMVGEGGFRQDLYFRLRVIEIVVPPLRDRLGDLPLLTRHILGRVCEDFGLEPLQVSPQVMDVMMQYSWPGNVRELENALTRAAVLAKGSQLQLQDLSLGSDDDPEEEPGDELLLGGDSLEDMERAHVQRILVRTGGNKSQAAQILKISRPRLDRIISKYGLRV